MRSKTPNHLCRKQWIALELSHAGEVKAIEGTLANILLAQLPSADKDHEVFVPCVQVHRLGRPYVYKLMEGYAFIRDGLPEMDYFSLEKTHYVEGVMSSHTSEGVRTCLMVADPAVQELKDKMMTLCDNLFSVGDCVKVLNGSFGKLTGWIYETGDSHSTVYFQPRSARIFKRIKNTSLAPSDEMEVIDFDSIPFPKYAPPRDIFELRDILHDSED